MKKTTLFLALCLLGTLFICGCSKKKESKQIEFITNRTDMVLGIPDASGKHDENTAAFKKLAAKFKKETGITVKLTGYNDFKNSLRRRLSSGDYGDVITNDDFPPKTIKNFFQPYGTKEEYKNYRFTNYVAIDNEVYGIAPGYYIDGVVYNKQVLKDAGFEKFPETYSQLLDVFKKVKSLGKIPIIINRGQAWPLRFVEQMAAEISGNPYTYNEMWKSNAPFSSSYPIGQAMLETAKWVNNGWTEPEFIKMWEESKTQLAKGDAFMMYLGSWIIPQIQARCKVVSGANAANIGYAPFPKLDSQKKHYILIEPEKPFLISKKTKNFEESKRWINYLIDSGIYEEQGALPIQKDKKTKIAMLQDILAGEEEGKYTFIDAPPIDANGGDKTLNLLKDLNGFTDSKYIGFPLDKAKVSMKDYEENIDSLNKQFEAAKKARNY